MVYELKKNHPSDSSNSGTDTSDLEDKLEENPYLDCEQNGRYVRRMPGDLDDSKYYSEDSSPGFGGTLGEY